MGKQRGWRLEIGIWDLEFGIWDLEIWNLGFAKDIRLGRVVYPRWFGGMISILQVRCHSRLDAPNQRG
jgi:hypothetical protein